jgi:hypothetical protein
MRITSAGRVGIGTAAPTRTLDVRGDILLSGGTLITGTLETTGKGTIDNELQINGGGDSTNTHFNLSDAGTNIISHASTGATTIRGNGASGDSMFKVESDGDVIHYYNSIFSGSVGVGGLITASGGVTLPATSDNFTMGGNAVNDILIDGDSYPGSSQDDYLITAKYLNTVSGAIVAAGGGGTIGGSIADNQIAFGATTANSIEGSDNLQFDGNNMTLAAGKHIYFNDTDASIHAGADSRLDVKGDSITFASGSTEVMRVNGGGLGIGTSAPTQPLDVITGDGVVIRRENTDSAIYGPSLYIDRKRATGGDLSSGDLIGNITFRPFETDYDNRAATISAAIEGTVTTDTTPGRLMFSTAAAGANTVTERMRIDSTGDVSINNSGKLKVVNASSDYWAIYNQANGKMRIDQGTTQRVLASSGEFQFANNIVVDGDVGIGTSSPSNKLHVLSTTTPQARVAYDGTYFMTTEVSSAGSTTWTNQKSFRFTGEQTDGVFQIDQNKIGLVRDTDSAASNVLQIGDHTTYDQFSIVEDQRGSSATNGLLYLRSKKTGNYGYATMALGAVSGSNTSYLYVNGISTNEALRFDTNSKSHAFDIAKAGYVSVGGAVDSTNQFTVVGTTHLSGAATVTGVLSATAKSFNIEHPLYKDKRLVHGSLEGPEHGIYIRGSIESKEYGCLIELPEYWDAMCEDYTVQLTPHGPYTVYIKEKQKDKVMVASTSREYKFDYYIVGSRTDETLEVVQDA